jgi:hypothetical protein
MQMADYNGWTNKETWLVTLWIDNDQGEQEYWLDVARRSAEEATRNCFSNNREQEQRMWIAERLANHYEESAEACTDSQAGLFSDLMNCALGAVNWHEIAEALLRDADEIRE